MSKKRGVVKTTAIVARVPAVIKTVAEEMAAEDGFSLTAYVDSLIRRDAMARGKVIKAKHRKPGFAPAEAQPSL